MQTELDKAVAVARKEAAATARSKAREELKKERDEWERWVRVHGARAVPLGAAAGA